MTFMVNVVMTLILVIALYIIVRVMITNFDFVLEEKELIFLFIISIILGLSAIILIWVKAIDKVDYSDPKIQMCMNCECIWCTKDPEECYKEKEKE